MKLFIIKSVLPKFTKSEPVNIEVFDTEHKGLLNDEQLHSVLRDIVARYEGNAVILTEKQFTNICKHSKLFQ